MRPFMLHTPRSVEEAVGLLRENGDAATLYAGGTELLLAMKHRVLHYAHVIDVKRIPRLASVMLGPAGELIIGAAATHYTLEQHPLVRKHLPAYAALSRDIGNIRVRVAGTLGGNLCFAEPHADPPTLLAAFDSRLILIGSDEIRQCSVDEFIVGAYETTRNQGEVLTEITVPRLPVGARVAYRRFCHLERPTVGVGVVLTTRDDAPATVATVQIWIGAVGPRPVRALRAERMLDGASLRDLDDGTVRDIAERIAGEIPVLADLHGSEDYKRALTATVVRRALQDVVVE